MRKRYLNRQFVSGFALASVLCIGVWGAHKWVKTHPSPRPIPVPDHVKRFDIASLIDVKNAQDVDVARTRLKTLFWGDGHAQNMHKAGLRVDSGYRDVRYEGMNNLERLDRVTVDMDYGINSVVYYFNPIRSNGQLILFHEGHDGDFVMHKQLIATLLARGFHVAAFAMPLMGMNSQPVLMLQGIGPLKLETHNALSYVNRENGHPARFFLEPVIRLLDHATARERFSRISMIGFSGGGWTTVMAAALDTRIDWSFPIAGTWPLILQSGNWGDWEQWDRNIYSIAKLLQALCHGRQREGPHAGADAERVRHLLQWRRGLDPL